MDKQKHYKNVVDYYAGSEIAYREGWDLAKSMAIHYGYADKNASTFKKSLLRTNEVLSNAAKISSTDSVLDAGCGVGGSAIYLAKTIGCNVLGITLSPRQVQLAKEFSQKYNVQHLTKFEINDYTSTNYANAKFDVVWALESVCHAIDKREFVKEAYRLLKPGGRLILADYFHERKEFNEEEKKMLSNWFEGWSLPNLDQIDEFKNQLKSLGMKTIFHEDATQKIIKSANRMFYLAIASKLYTNALSLFGIKRKNQVKLLNGQGAYWQKKALNRGLWKYYIVCVVKP